MRRVAIAVCLLLTLGATHIGAATVAPKTATTTAAPPTKAPLTPAPTPVPPTPAPTFPSGWISLFPPPYSGAPGIMMGIAAMTNTTQYVPGGSSGSGFGLYEFNGEENGQFTQLNMPDAAAMIMAIAAGGTPEQPKGVVGGFGVGNGIQYFVNSTTVEPSKVPTLFVVSQDIRMSRDGKNALVMDAAGSNTVLFSSDSGKTFVEKPVKIKVNPNCTNMRYGAMADASTYYVTFASWPSGNSAKQAAPKNSLRLSEAIHVERLPNGKLKHRVHRPAHSETSSSSGGNCPYAAAIAKTMDGGNTWIPQVNIGNGDFYFNGIDCFTPTHCIAVGEGFNENAGGHVWMTEDGNTWKEVFFQPSSAAGQYSFMAVKFTGSEGKEAWIGGSFMISQTASNGIFFRTTDGGKTWAAYPHGLPNLATISALSMLPDGKGFATASTIFDDSTILRYDPNGPPPPGYFTQLQCQTANCTGYFCQNASYPENFCLQLNNGGSATATCTAHALVQQVYATTDCTGSFNTTSLALNTCFNSGGTSFETFCPKKGEKAPPRPRRGKLLHMPRRH